MAVLMAAWSPLWCCCWLRGGLDLMLGRSAAGPGLCQMREVLAATGATATQQPMAGGCPHCKATRDDSCGRESPDSDGPSRDAPTCHCHDQGRDMVRDGTVVSCPPVFAAPAPPLPAIPPPCEVMSVGHRPRETLAPSPPTALLRLHTLLLT